MTGSKCERTYIPVLWKLPATQLFFENPLFKVVMFMRQSEKIRKMLLATRWSLVEAKGSQNCFVMLMVQNCMQYHKPLFMVLVVNVHATVRKDPKKASCDTVVTCWSKRGHKIILYTWWCKITGDLLNLCSWCFVSLIYDINNLTPTSW